MAHPSQDPHVARASGVFQTGDVLDGRYRIEHVIAEGGVAIVVAAEQLGLDRHVAIKLLRPEALSDGKLVEHFRSEGSLAAKIKSEHVVRIHDVGEGPGIGPYMVMELLEGHDLEQRLAAGPVPIEEAVDYVLQACDALVEAHHLRIVHRDIKPANLFVASRAPRAPILKIIDFGISKIVPRTVEGSTGELVAGTPAYMSPEQILQGHVVDARADIWALGVVLFELITKALPFPLDTPDRMLESICSSPPIAIRTLRPDVPEALAGVITRCLARDVSQRFGSVSELITALEPFRAVRDPMKSSGEIDIAHAYTDPRRQAETMVVEPTRSTRTVLVAAIAFVALAAVGTGLIFASRSRALDSRALETSGEVVPSPPAASALPAPVETSAPPPTVASAGASASASASSRSAAAAKVRPNAPAKTKPSTTPQKPASPAANDRSMFGERK